MDNQATTSLIAPKNTGHLINPNFPLLETGETMHLGVNRGDVANRVLSVGDHGRAARIAALLDNPESTHKVLSERGFTTYTNTYKGVPVSIIATGMGVAMMDFVVRECTLYVPGNMAMIRLGTTGLMKANLPAGTVAVSRSARFIQQNYDYEPENSSSKPFHICRAVESDTELKNLLVSNLAQKLTQEKVHEGVNITAETFYNAQGRTDDRFEDYNENLISEIETLEPEASNLEMETFKLLHLAKQSKGKIKACACAIGLVNRLTNDVMPFEKLREMEITCAQAILDTLASINL